MTTTSKQNTFPLILLCAGASTRMGSPKGLVPVLGQPFLLWQLQRFHAAGGTDVILVLGASRDEYGQEIPALKAASQSNRSVDDVCAGLNVRVVNHPQWRNGAFSSLLKGIEAFLREPSQSADAAFVSPVDTPLPKPLVWQQLAAAFHSAKSVIKPVYQGRGGHPVLLSRAFLQLLLQIDVASDAARLDVQMRQVSIADTERVDVSDSDVVRNLNDPTTLADWLASL